MKKNIAIYDFVEFEDFITSRINLVLLRNTKYFHMKIRFSLSAALMLIFNLV